MSFKSLYSLSLFLPIIVQKLVRHYTIRLLVTLVFFFSFYDLFVALSISFCLSLSLFAVQGVVRHCPQLSRVSLYFILNVALLSLFLFLPIIVKKVARHYTILLLVSLVFFFSFYVLFAALSTSFCLSHSLCLQSRES